MEGIKLPKVKVLEDRRSILVDPADGQPVTVTLDLIPSETTPGRVRYALSLPVEIEDPDVDGEPRIMLSYPLRIESN